jgi:hypothetical protein
VYLRQGRNFESQERPVVGRGPRREFGQQFRHRYALHITTLAQAILEERNRAPSLTDKDVLDAFEALKATAKTLSAGIHYETVPEGGSAAIGLYRRAKALVEEMMQPQESGYEALRASDAPDVLDFIVVSVELHSAGRPRSRRYLDWLSSMAPAPVEDDPAGGLIVP